MDGRKICRTIENPIDNILIDFAHFLNPYAKKLGATPNIITSISLLVSLVGIHYILKFDYKTGAILYFLGYFFDCMDGNFARTYNMSTVFGDWYDHISDFIKSILFFYAIYNLPLLLSSKFLLMGISGILFLISLIHLGCQQKHDDSSNKTVLDYLINFCVNKKHIHISKYFGCGTLFLITMVITFFLQEINQLIQVMYNV